jgi:glycosyltransferase involved in cell wall biosynthesis
MAPPRVLVISEIPTPYRVPLYERIADARRVDLSVVFLAHEEPDRPWAISEPLARVPHRVLKGWAPKLRLGGDTFVYEINPGIVPLLVRERPDVVVVGGYSLPAQQAAIAWARATRTPYMLHSESHLAKARPGWVTNAKRAVLPKIIAPSAAGLAVGTAASRYLAAYGLPPERIRILPNTIDVSRWGARAREIRADAERIRQERDLPERFHLFAGRLTEGKGVLELADAQAAATNALPLLVAGEGPLAHALAGVEGVRLLGFQDEPALAELLALADATVIPSRAETWGVVVNEALASGSFVIVSDAVGAVPDLVVDGVNGRIFAARDVQALRAALERPVRRLEPGEGAIARWTYEFGVEQFHEAVDLALDRA